MAMQYLGVCIFDFVIAPVGWAYIQSVQYITLVQWVPTTLGAGGTYHLAMGAVLGVAAWTRSKEKSENVMRSAYQSGVTDAEEGKSRSPLAGMEK